MCIRDSLIQRRQFGLRLFRPPQQLLLLNQTVFVVLLVLCYNRVVLSQHLSIPAKSALLLNRLGIQPRPPQFLGQDYILLLQILYLLLHLPLPQPVVLFLLAQPQLILFDQRLSPQIVLLLSQPLTMLVDNLRLMPLDDRFPDFLLQLVAGVAVERLVGFESEAFAE